MIQLLKQVVPVPVKKFIKGFKRDQKLKEVVSSTLPRILCVDVGASYYPHSTWSYFLDSNETSWIAVEPNEKNLQYTKNWVYSSDLKVCSVGLSQDGGPQTLFVTNVDSGSSLLEPKLPASVTDETVLNYFFPVKKIVIDTKTLREVIALGPVGVPTFVKLDTQGTELSILKGYFETSDSRIVGVEMESTMMADPVMQGAGKFWQANMYLESKGFELIKLKQIYTPSRVKQKAKNNGMLNECDAVFSLKKEVVAGMGLSWKVSLFAFYLSYFLYEEAYKYLCSDSELESYYRGHGVDINELKSLLIDLV